MFNLGLRTTELVVPKRTFKNEAHLIDGSNMFCRAHSSTLGKTIRKFMAMFGRIPKNSKYIAVVFDDAQYTWRHELLPNYKSNRSFRWDLEQLFIVRNLLHYRGIRVIASKKYEADDLIASASSLFKCPVYIHSEDKDFFQLLTENVSLIKDHKLFTVSSLEKSLGFTPSSFLEYQILVGDTVDKIPGMPMWGKDSAKEYLQKYGSLEGILANKSKLPTKLKNGLNKGIDDLQLMRKLLTLKKNILKKDVSYFETKPANTSKLSEIALTHGVMLNNFL